LSRDETSKQSAEKPAKVQVRDLKPAKDAKGGSARTKEASFLLDDEVETPAPKKQSEGA
jgi:hypothetical protein